MLDLRLPMGLMFSISRRHVDRLRAHHRGHRLGQGAICPHSLGININLWWGLALLAFGVIMLGLARWAASEGEAKK